MINFIFLKRLFSPNNSASNVIIFETYVIHKITLRKDLNLVIIEPNKNFLYHRHRER
jgi:hypothetical protein